MLNKMQLFLMDKDNVAVLWGVVKIFHPDVEETYTSPYNGKTVKRIDKLKIYTNYDWICIRGLGVSIGIQFEHPYNVWGKGHGLDVFEGIHRNSKFRAWRFFDDHGSKEGTDERDIHDLFVSNNVPRPTPKELFEYYYQD